MVPLLKVERLGQPFEGFIAMRDSSFGPLAETAAQATSRLAIIESERRPAARAPAPAAAFADGEAPGRLGGSASKRSR